MQTQEGKGIVLLKKHAWRTNPQVHNQKGHLEILKREGTQANDIQEDGKKCI